MNKWERERDRPGTEGESEELPGAGWSAKPSASQSLKI